MANKSIKYLLVSGIYQAVTIQISMWIRISKPALEIVCIQRSNIKVIIEVWVTVVTVTISICILLSTIGLQQTVIEPIQFTVTIVIRIQWITLTTINQPVCIGILVNIWQAITVAVGKEFDKVNAAIYKTTICQAALFSYVGAQFGITQAVVGYRSLEYAVNKQVVIYTGFDKT